MLPVLTFVFSHVDECVAVGRVFFCGTTDNSLRLEVLRTVLESRTVVSSEVSALLLILRRTGVELV